MKDHNTQPYNAVESRTKLHDSAFSDFSKNPMKIRSVLDLLSYRSIAAKAYIRTDSSQQGSALVEECNEKIRQILAL